MEKNNFCASFVLLQLCRRHLSTASSRGSCKPSGKCITFCRGRRIWKCLSGKQIASILASSILSSLLHWIITTSCKRTLRALETHWRYKKNPQNIPTAFLCCPLEIFSVLNDENKPMAQRSPFLHFPKKYSHGYFHIISFHMQDPRHGKYVHAESNSFLWQMFLFRLVFPQNKASAL